MNDQQGNRERVCAHDENLFPDCVCLSLQPKESSNSTIPIHVDISFNSAWIEIPVPRLLFLKKMWRVQFAIKAGDLVFALSNLTSPPDRRNYVKDLRGGPNISHNVTVTSESSDETTDGVSVTVEIKPPGPTVSLNAHDSVKSTKGLKVEQSDEFPLPFVTISAKGDDKEPKWSFICTATDRFLDGYLKDWLADFRIEKIPYRLIAMFRTSYNDILINQVDYPEYEQLQAKKKWILSRRMKKYVHGVAQQYFSKVELSWENHA